MALLFAYMSLLTGQSQHKKCMAGIDIPSILQGSAEINISYRINSHWSTTGEVSFPYGSYLKGPSILEKEHDAEFSSGHNIPQVSDVHCERLIFSFWTKETFHGPYISIGIQSGSRSGTEIVNEAGIAVPVWKNINISTALRTHLIQSIVSGSLSTDNLKISINYTF